MQTIVGWDIGGAHVKAAHISDGRVMRVRQMPCPLWRGLDELRPVVRQLQSEFGPTDLHVATMTGELADIFPDRRTGVISISAVLADTLSAGMLRLYGGRSGFLVPTAVEHHAADIASANWHASAALAARHGDGIFVDIGSTTTDIVALRGGNVLAAGYSDAERLASGELVYTGLTRSFVMALASRAPFRGAWTTIAGEYFASSADVYRVLGLLDETADQMAAADGREKTVVGSRARLARMIGHDAADATDGAWQDLAAWFAEAQIRMIHDGAVLVLSRAELPREAPLIAAGVGGVLVRTLAERLGRPCRSFAGVVDAEGVGWVDACAPAVAVALLAADGPAAA